MRRPLLRSHPASVEVSMPSLTSSRVARGVRPSPQTFSRGKWAFSRTRTSRPARARYAAVVEPPGPAPTTMTSALVGTSDGGSPVNRFVGFTVSSPVGDEHGSAYVPRCDNAILRVRPRPSGSQCTHSEGSAQSSHVGPRRHGRAGPWWPGMVSAEGPARWTGPDLVRHARLTRCLLYTSDAADEEDSVDLG